MSEDETSQTGLSVPKQTTRMTGVFEIRDLETLRTIADPLRMQIFEQLAGAPLTVKELASRLGLSSSRLYYHMNVLEEHELIQVVGQNIIGNLVEKVYRAAAGELDVAPTLLAFDTPAGKESISTMAASTLDTTREDLMRSLEARAYALQEGAPERRRPIMVTRTMQRIPESQAALFQERLSTLFREFDAAAVGEGGEEDAAHAYALMIALYPHFDYPRAGEAADEQEEA